MISRRASEETNQQTKIHNNENHSRIYTDSGGYEPANGTFDAPTYVDLDAREKWFWQATFESPAMFRRQAGGGSVYWFAARDMNGVFVDGSKTYKLTIPQPVPVKLFWSVTVYDPDTRSEIVTDQGKAALRSLFEL